MKGLTIGLGAKWPALAILSLAPMSAFATCPVPNTLTNGQVADASQVMDNFNAVASCADSAVTPTGTPTSGSIAVFSGLKSVTSSDLSGDVITNGSTATTLAATGVTAGVYSNPTIAVDAKGRVVSATSGSGGGGGSTTVPVLVQLAGARGTSGGQSAFSATLGAPPAVGDLLVTIISGYSVGSNFICPSGFGAVLDVENVVPYQGVMICARAAQSGDGVTYTSTVANPNGGTTFVVLEIFGASGISANCEPGPQAPSQIGSSWSVFGKRLNSSTYSLGMFENDSGGQFSSIVGGNAIYDGTSSTVNHPFFLFSIPELNTVSVNYSGSSFGYSLACFLHASA